ncbi:putative TBC domain-containing protein [Neospora caninum Liverpool]|uniref:Putative TBC domain-containing protein n=1 Tax=Neospora caninum (strain Liverpool) TaxID=572307 RepID=F0VF35_NEOCL|nr:putative TBC domain-containing protein [Neospora caninum Liverpool]CBZ52329.1 putative TBC domain-containing protein [Neospora caninum Liverpool]|eukprot:XP_003882361.1 putative TBC domain-containing protein [Neospora caninum Liverpool]
MSFLWSGSALISFSGLGGPSNTKEEDVALEEASERGTVASAPAAHLEESDGEKRGEQQWRELDEVWSGNGENREPQRTGKSLFPFVSNGSRSGPDRDWPSTTPEALPPHDAAADESGVCTPPPVAPSSGSWRQSGSLRKSNHLRGDPRFWSPPRETHASEPRQLGSGDSHSLVGAAESLSPREDAVAQGSSRMPLTYGVLGERAGESRHAVAQPGGLPPYPVPTASRSLSPTLSPRMDERISPLSAREDGDRKGNFESQMHPPLVGRPVEEGTPSREDTEQEAAPHHFGRPGIHRKTGSGDEGRGRDADVSCRDRTMAADDLPRDVKTQLSFGGSGPRRTSLSGSVPAPSESLLQQRQHNRRQQQELLQHSSSSSSSSSAFPSRLRHSSPAADPATASQERRGRWAQSRRDSDGAVAAASPSSSDHGGVEREIDGGVGWARRRGGSERPEEQEGDAVAAAAARAARRRVLLQKLFGVKNSASGERGERKWQSMEDRNLVHFMHMHRHTFFRRLRRGVPPSHRWNAWKAVCLPPPEHRCACPSSSFPTSESVDASGAPGHGFHPQSQPLISCVSSPAAGGVGSALTRTFSSPQRPLAGGPGTAGRTERECRRADSGEASFAPSQRQRGQGKEGEPLDTACGPGGNCREGRRSLATDAGRREGHDRRRLSGQEARKLTGGEEHEDAVGCCRAGGDCRRVYEREAERRSSFFALIMIDVPRTFPDVEVFDKDAQALLCRNLNAFANIHPEVGYCQGMNFIAGLLLLVSSFDEFDAFCVFRALMQRYRLKGFFQEKFPLLRKYMKVFDTLASQQLPELRQHFLDEGVLPAVYLHQWFLTLFVTSLPLRSVCVLWDFLLGEGLHGLLELAVALLKVLTRFIIHLRFEEVVKFLKSLKSSGGGCDDFKVGKMLVKQAAKVQVPDALLQELLTADLAVLMREAEEEEVAEAQARAAGVAAAAAAAAVPEDGAQGNPLVETLTEEEEGEDEAFDRGGLHRVSHHGGMWKEKRHHERSERQERGAQYGEAAALAAGRGGSHVHAQRGDCTEDESREKRTAFSPELGAAQQRVSSAFSSWDELPSPCGSRRHSVSSGKREGGDASGRERGEQQGRRGRSGTSPPRRPGGDLQDEEMQVLTSTIPLRPEGEGETLRRRASSLSDGADAEAILGSASAPVAHSATVQHARSPPSSPVDALNASPASFASEAAWQLPERADAGCRAPFAKASEVKLASPSTSFPPRSPKASSLHGREAAAALRCSGEDGRRTEATEESGRTRRERSVCAELRAHFPSACESLEAVSFVRGWSGIGNEGEESETEERRGSVSPSSRASRANRAKLPKPACGVSARGQCSFDRFPSKLRRTGTPWGKGEGAPKGEGEQRREEGGADAKDQGTEKKQAVAFGASSDGSSPLLEEPADEETTERRRNSGEALVLNAENLQDEAEREGFLPCYRLTGEEREEAIAMRLVELSPRCCKRLQTGPHLTPCNKRASTVETETSTVSSCPQLSTLSSSTPSGSPRRTRRPSSVAVPASPVVAEETPLESTGACQEQDSQRGRTGPEGDECSGGEGKQVAKSGGSKRGFVGVITRLLPVNKLALPGLSSSFFLPARSRGTAHPVEEGPAPDSPAVPDGRHADAPGQTQSVSGGAGLEA